MRVVTTWDKEINSDFLGTFLGFLLQHKDADLISHSFNNLSDDCQCQRLNLDFETKWTNQGGTVGFVPLFSKLPEKAAQGHKSN